MFCLSLDTELAWGVRNEPYFTDYRRRFVHARDVIDRLCTLFDRYRVPATWAVVGHLMLSSAETRPPMSTLQLPRPENVDPGGWFRDTPCGGVTEAPDWFGADLIERILMCRTKQELASHSFTHLAFDERRTPVEAIVNELRAARAAAHNFGIVPKSFIFPYNIEGYHYVLKNAGYLCYRGSPRQWYDRYPAQAKRMGRWLDQLLAVPPPAASCERHPSGLINVPATMFLMPFDGSRGLIPSRSRLAKARAGIRDACEHGGLMHLWAHPHNFYLHPERMLGVLETILQLVVEERDAKRIEALGMADVALRLMGDGALGEAQHAAPQAIGGMA